MKGLAQFIFSEFCRQSWSDRPLVNVGDDWGLQTLAWTKQSYRPVKLLNKHVLRKVPAVVSGAQFLPNDSRHARSLACEPTARQAPEVDLLAAPSLTEPNFSSTST